MKRLEVAQYISDEFGSGKEVMQVEIIRFPAQAQITFRDGTTSGLMGLFAHKVIMADDEGDEI